MAAEPRCFNIVLGSRRSLCEASRARDADPPMPLEADVDLTIRHAQAGDAAVLAQLMCELGYETTKSEMRMRVERIAPDERYRTFVAVRDGKVCGMIGTLTYPSYEHNDPSGRILALVTLSAARRRGIGRALITTAEKDFASRHVTRVTLTTRFEREGAHQFYEVFGYAKTGFRFAKNLSGTSRE
jgi:ribosomal protein S18 acetylase RimI-like enzyme